MTTVKYPFNFFASLPVFAMDIIKNQTEVDTMIKLASCSKRCNNAVRRAKSKPEIIRVKIENNSITILLSKRKKSWSVECGDEKLPKVDFIFASLPIMIDNDNFKTAVNNRKLNSVIDHVLAKLKELYSTAKLKIEIDGDTLPRTFQMKTALACVSQCEKFEFFGDKANYLHVRYLLENIKANDKIEIDIASNLSITKTKRIDPTLMLTTKRLYCADSCCITGTDFLKMSCQEASLCCISFSPKYIVARLQNWKNAPIEEVKDFIGFQLHSYGIDMKIPNLESLNAEKWNPKKRGRFLGVSELLCCRSRGVRRGRDVRSGRSGPSFKYRGAAMRTINDPYRACDHYIDCTEGWVITREDGLIGTVVKHRNTLLFLVSPRHDDEDDNASENDDDSSEDDDDSSEDDDDSSEDDDDSSEDDDDADN